MSTGTTWTIAYRNPRANHFKRVANWEGTWAEAFEMAQAFGELNPGLQIFYVPTAAHEQRERDRVNAGTLLAAYAEDHGNILLESGKRVKMRETGTLPAELLDKDLENFAHAVYGRAGGAGQLNLKGEPFTLAFCREMGVRARELSPVGFQELVRTYGTADERFTASAEGARK